MRNPHQTFFPILTTLILCLPAAMQADNVTYTWVSSDGDPFGINGTIVLDSSASSAGSFADVVSITISTPLYTDNVNLSSDTLIDFTAAWTPSGYFDWNPTQITDMGLTKFGPNSDGGPVYAAQEWTESYPAIPILLQVNGETVGYDLYGAWESPSTSPMPETSSVPETSYTLFTLLFTASILVAARHISSRLSSIPRPTTPSKSVLRCNR